MRIRKSAAKLPSAERARYVNAIKALKQDIVRILDDGTRVSRYDQLVALHLGVTRRLINQVSIGDGGHRGPAFLSWHRQYLLMLEDQLRAVDSAVTIPYWEWTDRAGTENVIFQDDFMGPRGSVTTSVGTVASGHFTSAEGWRLIGEIHRSGVSAPERGPDLLRSTSMDVNLLPTQQRIDQIFGQNVFAGPGGFQEELEGDPHGTLHMWVGGMSPTNLGTMTGMSSPNDPIFFLHHGEVDRLWAEWQDNGHAGPNFYPDNGPRIGHGLQDPMWPWDGGQATTLPYLMRYLSSFSETVRPADVLDFRALGITYDTLLPVLGIGQPVTDVELSAPGDEQGFRIFVREAGRYRIEKQGPTDVVMALHGPDSWEPVTQNGGPGTVASVADLNPGTYFVVFRHADSSGTGRFSLSLQQEDRIVVDSVPVLLTVDGSPVQAFIAEGGEVDVYRFTVHTPGRHTIETEGATDVVMGLFGPDDRNDLVTQNDDGGQGLNARISRRLTAGTYHIEVRHYAPIGIGRYRISVRTDTVPTELEVDGPEIQANIGAANESDLYTFRTTTPGIYMIETSGLIDTYLTLYGPDNDTTVIAQDDDGGPGLLSRIEQPLGAGRYYVRARHYSPFGTGSYSVRLQSL
ncbi:MAG: tyrosinase family protein [Alphaproteobacteria bacterium]|nr:tyrosinase family protein [Alphaproteobacteria bacterium]